MVQRRKLSELFCNSSADAFVSIYTSTADNAGELFKKVSECLVGAVFP